jgi:hypothetical protein
VICRRSPGRSCPAGTADHPCPCSASPWLSLLEAGGQSTEYRAESKNLRACQPRRASPGRGSA